MSKNRIQNCVENEKEMIKGNPLSEKIVSELWRYEYLLNNRQSRVRAGYKLGFLAEKLAEVPAERREAYCSFVGRAVKRMLQGATAQEIWHDWQWSAITLPMYRKNLAKAV